MTTGEASVRPKPSVILALVMFWKRRMLLSGKGEDPDMHNWMQVRSYSAMFFCCMSEM